MATVQDIAGGLNLYGVGLAGPFDQDARDIAATFAGVAVLNATTHAGALLQVDQMKRAMTSRSGIEQAQGLLMGQRGCTAEEAFAVLVKLSSQSNRKLRGIATEVVQWAIRRQ
jgi:hypothetical protein